MTHVFLADNRVDPSAKENDAWIVACGSSHLRLMKLLLSDRRVNPNARNAEALRTALSSKRMGVVELLLSSSRVSLRSVSMALINDGLIWACEAGMVPLVKRLLDAGAEGEVRNNYCIRESARRGHHETVELLIKSAQRGPSSEPPRAADICS
jgi:ankyrin repeat protein